MKIIKRYQQTEAHDWLGEAAESIVRYYFSRIGLYAYGASRWGGDAVIQEPITGKMLVIEIKSTDREGSSNRLKRSLKKKLSKLKPNVKASIYAEVRLKDSKTNQNQELLVTLWKIKSGKMDLDSKCNDLRVDNLKGWIKHQFQWQ